jgi:hypothetical protein
MLNVLHFYVSTVRFTCAVHSMAVSFRNSLISCFPGMLLSYCLSDFDIVPVAPIITGTDFLFFTFHISRMSTARSSYFIIFWASLLIKFTFQEFSTSINVHVPFLLPQTMRSGFWLRVVLSVGTGWSIIRLTHFHDLFLLVLEHVHTSVHCLIFLLLRCTC